MPASLLKEPRGHFVHTLRPVTAANLPAAQTLQPVLLVVLVLVPTGHNIFVGAFGGTLVGDLVGILVGAFYGVLVGILVGDDVTPLQVADPAALFVPVAHAKQSSALSCALAELVESLKYVFAGHGVQRALPVQGA